MNRKERKIDEVLRLVISSYRRPCFKHPCRTNNQSINNEKTSNKIDEWRSRSKKTKTEANEKESEYIRKYRPLLNAQIPEKDNWRKYSYNEHAAKITTDEFIAAIS